ncbi:MAG TPA: SCP2 sterol-binding domain-containing protein [Iamia sp.]|nr:SCP2 sterol-binding domain-containing protein [Iamia sp.]
MPPALGTDAWIAAADAAAHADEGLREASVGRRIVIGQEVVDGERRTRWHLVLDDGEVAVRAGWPDDPDVTFSQDAAVAGRVARGEVAARTAFVLGQVRLGGDVARLLDVAPALARLGDVFGAVRMDDLGPEAGAV